MKLHFELDSICAAQFASLTFIEYVKVKYAETCSKIQGSSVTEWRMDEE